MRQDNLGQVIVDEQDLCDLYMRDPERRIRSCLVETDIKIDPELELSGIPEFVTYAASTLEQETFDAQCQSNWHMPTEYRSMDIAAWLLEQCKTETELQRVGQELLLYQERDMFDLLRYLKYMVDTLRLNNMIWGVGRGSSVASYVLYLIGVHKVDSIYYDLDIQEFLR